MPRKAKREPLDKSAIEYGPLDRMTLATDEAPDEFERRIAEMYEGDSQEWAAATGNPLFVWEAIEHRHNVAHRRAIAAWEPPKPFPKLDRPPLPDWISEYLEMVSWRINELRLGRDWREFPKWTGNEKTDDEAFQRYKDRAPLAPAEVAELISLTMGFTRNGWNAVSAWRRIRASQYAVDEIESLQYESLARPALRPGEAKAHVMKEFGFEDERNFRRFLAKSQPKARKRRAKPTAED